MKNDFEIILNEAKDFYNNNEFKNALKYFIKALDLNINKNFRGEIFFDCGRCTFFMDKYTEANKYFEESEKYLDTLNVHTLFLYYYYSGLTNVFLKNFKIAGDKLSMLLRNQTTEDELAMYHYAMSIYYYRLENFKVMKSFCENALNFKQNKVYEDLLLFYLAQYYESINDKDGLLNIIKKYLISYPDSNYFKDIAGDMYEMFLERKEEILKMSKFPKRSQV